jgi:uncharacterized protein YndB with AHSA1/START domain
MSRASKIAITTDGEQHLTLVRRFAAAPGFVYRAHIEPELLRQWMTGPDGWTMPECRIDARPGGSMYCAWSHPEEAAFHLTAEFIALEPNRRIEHVELMFLPDPTPDNHIVTTFEPDGEGTVLTVRMTLPDAETRQAMLDIGMLDGMATSYDRLEELAGQ